MLVGGADFRRENVTADVPVVSRARADIGAESVSLAGIDVKPRQGAGLIEGAQTRVNVLERSDGPYREVTHMGIVARRDNALNSPPSVAPRTVLSKPARRIS